jgi:chromosome segregation ATPase
MARFNITLPTSIAKMLDQDAEHQDIARSTLIAQHIAQHYEGRSEADYEAEIREQRAEYEKQVQDQRAESANIVQRVRAEYENKIEKLIAEHDAEIQQIRADSEKQIQQVNADRSASIQQLENSLEELESVTHQLDANLKETGERNRSLVDELRESEASKNVVVTGLQHRVELLEKDKASLEAALQVEKGHSLELKADKETLQKQVELQMLQLPAPKVGFWSRGWSRIFSRGKT